MKISPRRTSLWIFEDIIGAIDSVDCCGMTNPSGRKKCFTVSKLSCIHWLWYIDSNGIDTMMSILPYNSGRFLIEMSWMSVNLPRMTIDCLGLLIGCLLFSYLHSGISIRLRASLHESHIHLRRIQKYSIFAKYFSMWSRQSVTIQSSQDQRSWLTTRHQSLHSIFGSCLALRVPALLHTLSQRLPDSRWRSHFCRNQFDLFCAWRVLDDHHWWNWKWWIRVCQNQNVFIQWQHAQQMRKWIRTGNYSAHLVIDWFRCNVYTLFAKFLKYNA